MLESFQLLRAIVKGLSLIKGQKKGQFILGNKKAKLQDGF